MMITISIPTRLTCITYYQPNYPQTTITIGCCAGMVLGPDRRDPRTASNHGCCGECDGDCQSPRPFLKPFYYCGCAPRVRIDPCFQQLTSHYKCVCAPTRQCIKCVKPQINPGPAPLPPCSPRRKCLCCENDGWCAVGDVGPSFGRASIGALGNAVGNNDTLVDPFCTTY